MRQKEDLLRQIPQVDKLMQHTLAADCEVYRHEIAGAVRDVLDELREQIKTGAADNVPEDEYLMSRAVDLAKKRVQTGKDVRRVINGTGVILHSNLGRACLSKAAAAAVVEAASSYCTLEYDVEKGKRGNRTGGVEKYLRDITGCEASLVVNNNAAAVLLILSAIASDGNVLVSRGELVEIGGGFRVPDIISLCGCTLREVGTTNKTRLSDYEAVITADTRAIRRYTPATLKSLGLPSRYRSKSLQLSGKHMIFRLLRTSAAEHLLTCSVTD